MSQKYRNLRQEILTLHNLHQRWLQREIFDELINNIRIYIISTKKDIFVQQMHF